MKALEIARVSLVRLLRDRMGLFFVFLLPVVIIVVLGAMYGGRTAPRLGVVVAAGSGPLASELVGAVEAGPVELEVKRFESEAAARAALEAGGLELVMIVPPDYDTALRTGAMAELTLVGELGRPWVIDQAVRAAVADQSALVRAARLVEHESGKPFEEALEAARAVAPTLAGLEVTVTDVGTRTFPADIGPFSLGAQGQLVLFMFLTSMTAATQLILTRQLGVSRRMMSTPTPVGTILAGETLGRFSVAMLQGLFIVFLSGLAFDVDWGDPLAAALLVVSFALVGTGVAMLIGVLGGNVDQAGTAGVFLGMLLGALGGAMIPLEVLGEPMRTMAYVTPHAWALDGFRTLVFRDGGVGDILVPLGVLLTCGLATCAFAAWRYRRALTGG